MRAIAICVVLAATAAGCLRGTAFRCESNTDCGTTGTCESIGYCSIANAGCVDTGRSYTESAGQGLANTCVTSVNPDAGLDAGADASIDGMINVGCPSGYAEIAGSLHRYKSLVNVSWDDAQRSCKQTSASAYLAVPDDETELANLATIAAAPFWIGLDDKTTENTFVTQQGAPATFKPWAMGEPDNGPPDEDCVNAISGTEIATDRCGNRHAAVCECEP